jgi:hypothetical protein
MIYNIRNRNEMMDRNLSGNTANLPNRKEIDNNRKGVKITFCDKKKKEPYYFFISSYYFFSSILRFLTKRGM